MFKLWGKIIKDNKIISDQVFELEKSNLCKEEKINLGIESFCYNFDISKPMWLSDNNNFYQIGITRFMSQHFIEQLEFDYLEIELIEDKE